MTLRRLAEHAKRIGTLTAILVFPGGLTIAAAWWAVRTMKRYRGR